MRSESECKKDRWVEYQLDLQRRENKKKDYVIGRSILGYVIDRICYLMNWQRGENNHSEEYADDESILDWLAREFFHRESDVRLDVAISKTFAVIILRVREGCGTLKAQQNIAGPKFVLTYRLHEGWEEKWKHAETEDARTSTIIDAVGIADRKTGLIKTLFETKQIAAHPNTLRDRVKEASASVPSPGNVDAFVVVLEQKEPVTRCFFDHYFRVELPDEQALSGKVFDIQHPDIRESVPLGSIFTRMTVDCTASNMVQLQSLVLPKELQNYVLPWRTEPAYKCTCSTESLLMHQRHVLDLCCP